MSSHAGCTKKYGYTNLLEDTNLIGPSWAKATIEAELYIGKLKEKKADLKIDYRYEIISPTEGAVVVGNDKKTIKFRITKRNAAKKLTRQQTIVYSDEHYY
ncbi:MAG TPA: hypothetical protein VHA56_02650 [Mucilaginibacter sp.]|nr:hypothetical protein [Mucilaginibacter sp.]